MLLKKTRTKHGPSISSSNKGSYPPLSPSPSLPPSNSMHLAWFIPCNYCTVGRNMSLYNAMKSYYTNQYYNYNYSTTFTMQKHQNESLLWSTDIIHRCQRVIESISFQNWQSSGGSCPEKAINRRKEANIKHYNTFSSYSTVSLTLATYIPQTVSRRGETAWESLLTHAHRFP